MFSLSEKTALITGASGGIGHAIAQTLAMQGANLILSGTKESVLNQIKIDLLSKYPSSKIEISLVNLMNNDDVDQLFSKAEDLIGPIDILINNAGMTRDTLLMRMKDSDWNDVIQVNLNATFKLCQNAVKSMMKRRYGRIINISSVVATTGNAGQTNYCAAKAGMIGFSKALALEVATRNITVNCVAPGFIDTAMTEKIPEKIKENLLANIPMKRMGESADVASCVAFLSAAESSYITGQTFHINGGLEMV